MRGEVCPPPACLKHPHGKPPKQAYFTGGGSVLNYTSCHPGWASPRPRATHTEGVEGLLGRSVISPAGPVWNAPSLKSPQKSCREKRNAGGLRGPAVQSGPGSVGTGGAQGLCKGTILIPHRKSGSKWVKGVEGGRSHKGHYQDPGGQGTGVGSWSRVMEPQGVPEGPSHQFPRPLCSTVIKSAGITSTVSPHWKEPIAWALGKAPPRSQLRNWLGCVSGLMLHRC